MELKYKVRVVDKKGSTYNIGFYPTRLDALACASRNKKTGKFKSIKVVHIYNKKLKSKRRKK